MTKVPAWFSRGLGQISGVYTATFIFLRPKQKYKRKGKYTELALNLIEKIVGAHEKLLLHVYVSVNLWNQVICELTENFRQFVICLFQSVNLFFYACKTLKPGLFWYAVDTNLFRLESTNPKKKFPDPGCSLMGGHSLHQKKKLIYIFFGGGFAPHQSASRVWEFFCRIGGL